MLEFLDVCKTYPIDAEQQVTALDGVTLHINAGESVAIVGSNGSGKTSLLKCAAGMLAPESGSVRIDGKAVTSLRPAQLGALVGIVFQNPAQGAASYLTVEENLAMGAIRGRRPGLRMLFNGEVKHEVQSIAKEVSDELPTRLQQRCGTLSGGQRQSVALLTTVLGRPRILLLDEHTASLDPTARAAVWSLTARLATQYCLTVLAVTHSVTEALSFGTRLLVMHKGKVVLDLRAAEKRSLDAEGLLAMLKDVGGHALVDEASVAVSATFARRSTSPSDGSRPARRDDR